MQATTAKPGLPRRWTVEVDGIRWIPRMIDKARMRAGGTLGAYLLGHSPVDRACLRRLGVTTEEFAQLATAAPDDETVLAQLRRNGFDEARLRAWSASFPTRYKTYIHLWDIDEGYAKPSAFEAPLVAMFRTIEEPVMGLYRKLVTPP